MQQKNKYLLLILIVINLNNFFLFRQAKTYFHPECFFFDVGQGDASLLRYKNKTILIDGGDSRQRSRNKNKLLSLLKKNGIKKIDLMILSHPHSDHLGGLVEVMKRMKVNRLIIPQHEHSTHLYMEFQSLIQVKNIKFHYAYYPMQIRYHSLKLDIISPLNFPPCHFSQNSDPVFNSIDNHSLVFQMTLMNSRILYTGDIYFPVEKWLTDHYGQKLESAILKIPHHGSKKASSLSFMKAVRPKLSIISCGQRNPFGMPHPDTLSRVTENSLYVHRTDQEGTLKITFYSDRIFCESSKKRINIT